MPKTFTEGGSVNSFARVTQDYRSHEPMGLKCRCAPDGNGD